MAYECILIEQEGPVGIVTLNRPDALNAFNTKLMSELTKAVEAYDADPEIGCIVVTGSEKAFAAGADIKEMADKSFVEAYMQDFITANWEATSRARTPIIAAVSGYALGG
ncbi:MAG: enoyl-CoA hydratase-related protein, partial [Pseudomonadota bacterium]